MKKINILLIFALLFFSLQGIAQTYSLKGAVQSESDDVLSGCNVALESAGGEKRFTTTDKDGSFVFDGLAPGKYNLSISFVGYQSYHEKININENTKIEITLQPVMVTLGEVMVTSLRQQKEVKKYPLPIEVSSSEDINKQVYMTPADALQYEPGVYLSRDGIWATSVNIRGLSEQRLIGMINGNRIETATDLAAGLSMIDVYDIERIEVVKGAASSFYGTGGLGGVVNFVTKQGYFSEDGHVHAGLSGDYNSVNEYMARNLYFSAGNERWNLRISDTKRDAGNTMTPQGELPNSQFEDRNLSVSGGLKIADKHYLNVNYQNFEAKDVGIPGGAPFPGPSEATYQLAERKLFSADYTFKNDNRLFSRLNLKYFWQEILREVELIPNTPSKIAGTQRITANAIYPNGLHTTQGVSLTTQWNLSDNNKLMAGIDAWQRKLQTDREKYITIELLDAVGNVVAVNKLIRGETPIPESQFTSAGVFLQDEWDLFNEKLMLLVGARYDYIIISNEETYDPDYIVLNGVLNTSPDGQRITFSEGTEYNKSWSINTGLLYRITNDLHANLNLARSFRSPSLEERFKYIDLGSSVRIGDPALEPEDGYSIDLGFRVWKKLQVKLDLFYNQLSNMIVEEQGEYIYTINTGPQTGLQDTIPALINTNAEEARLFGFDLGFEYQALTSLKLFGTGSYVNGKNTKTDEYLPMIPPLTGRLGVTYFFRKVMDVSFLTRLAADQNNLATGEKKTGGYAVYNLVIEFKTFSFIHKNLKAHVVTGIHNITDRPYANHLSTNRGLVDIEPGRNYFLKMSLSF